MCFYIMSKNYSAALFRLAAKCLSQISDNFSLFMKPIDSQVVFVLNNLSFDHYQSIK